MADVKFRTFPAGHFGVLRGALEKAIEALPEVERTSAIKACLADKILTLAATAKQIQLILDESLWRGCEIPVANAGGAKAWPRFARTGWALFSVTFLRNLGMGQENGARCIWSCLWRNRRSNHQ